tara:strand:- start:1372 stop:2949 length:1578 start_codon:yes stop_codon:yes gene_type:complete
MNENEEYEIQGYQELYEDIDDFKEYDNALVESEKVYKESLPKVVLDYVKSAEEVSHYNAIPASISYFTILGNICKDFVHIPNGRNHEDVRVHFCWVQTSGTGKSTLWNFVEGVSDAVFDKINQEGTHPPFIDPDTKVGGKRFDEAHPNGLPLMDNDGFPIKFNTFSVIDYTDSSLIGKFDQHMTEEGEKEFKRRAGVLEGMGLAHWDEFEYSGIFKQSQHKENSIVYLNTLMNSLAGKSWIISKALDSQEGRIMNCYAMRSVFATTYPPNNINQVMAEKGVLQRMLLYIWEVPAYKQHEMRLKQYAKSGTIEDVDTPVETFSDEMFEIYKELRKKYYQNGGNPLLTIEYTDEYRSSLMEAYRQLLGEMRGVPEKVTKLASTFLSRIMVTLMKVSTLCCIAETLERKEEDRFKVTGDNVRSAGLIVRQCYKTLLEWLERSLRSKKPVSAKAGENYKTMFTEAYEGMKKDDKGYVNKKMYMLEARNKLKLSRSQTYEVYNKYGKGYFEEIKEGRSFYIRIKKTGDEE